MRLDRRQTLLGFVSSFALAKIRRASAAGLGTLPYSGASISGSQWYDVQIGGGGECTGMDINADGTLAPRVDVYGGYVGSTTLGTTWAQLIRTDTMPSPMNGSKPFYGVGIVELKIAPSNSSFMIMMYCPTAPPGTPGVADAVYYTSNRGATWTASALNTLNENSNDSDRFYGQRMAIDPANTNVWYVGSKSAGVQVTSNGGTSFTQIPSSTIANPTSGFAYYGIQFDPTSGTTGGKTNRIIVPSYGTGAYVSSNVGSTWALTSGGPTNIIIGKMQVDGTYYCIDNTGSGNVWRLTTSNVWTEILVGSSIGTGVNTVACDPNNITHIAAIAGSGAIDTCENSTSATPTWDGVNNAFKVNTGAGTHEPGWPAAANASFLSITDAYYDPSVADRLWLCHGDGVLYTNSIPGSGSTQEYYTQYFGIENLVARWVTFPPGGNPVLIAEDYPVWPITHPNSGASGYGPVYAGVIDPNGTADYAPGTPTFVAFPCAHGNGIFTASDGGASNSWTSVATAPSNLDGSGCVAIGTTTNFAYRSLGNGTIAFTANGGSSWALASGPPSDARSVFLFRCDFCSDRVTAGKYYFYLAGGGANGGIWSLTSGTALTQVWNGTFGVAGGDGYNCTLKSVPGNAGHLFYTNGPQDGPTNSHPVTGANGEFYRSINGGVSWSNVSNGSYTIGEVWAFGFSATRGGSGYPAVCIAGWVNGVWGIWESIDDCATWQNIGAFPLNWIDEINCLEGDPSNSGRYIVGKQGSGWNYYGPDAD